MIPIAPDQCLQELPNIFVLGNVFNGTDLEG